MSSKKKVLIISGVVVVVIAVIVAMFLLRPPKDQPVVAGQQVIVKVVTGAVSDVFGYEFHMNYNENDYEYTAIASTHDEIYTIFQKPFDGYRLVGATMVGQKPGFSGKNVSVCEITFTAKRDGMLSEMPFSLSNVNIVKVNPNVDITSKDSLTYETDQEGWTLKVSTVALEEGAVPAPASQPETPPDSTEG